MDRSRTGCRKQGFTLIELLVVIGIIGLLAAIIVPALNGALRTATKARAMQMCKDLQGACQRYFSEYNRMPVPKGVKHGQDDAKYADDNFEVIDILILSDDLKETDLPVTNPRSIRFLDMDAKTFETYNEAKENGLLDPWDNPYEIFLDMNFDDVIDLDALEIQAKVGVRSFGPDGKEDTKDDIRTW